MRRSIFAPRMGCNTNGPKAFSVTPLLKTPTIHTSQTLATHNHTVVSPIQKFSWRDDCKDFSPIQMLSHLLFTPSFSLHCAPAGYLAALTEFHDPTTREACSDHKGAIYAASVDSERPQSLESSSEEEMYDYVLCNLTMQFAQKVKIDAKTGERTAHINNGFGENSESGKSYDLRQSRLRGYLSRSATAMSKNFWIGETTV